MPGAFSRNKAPRRAGYAGGSPPGKYSGRPPMLNFGLLGTGYRALALEGKGVTHRIVGVHTHGEGTTSQDMYDEPLVVRLRDVRKGQYRAVFDVAWEKFAREYERVEGMAP